MRSQFDIPHSKNELEDHSSGFSVHIKADLHGRTGELTSPKMKLLTTGLVSIHFQFKSKTLNNVRLFVPRSRPLCFVGSTWKHLVRRFPPPRAGGKNLHRLD